MLSGGGSKGAWGAGVLNGWTQATTGPKRPVFDVVTGVSTGALQATGAFLGSDYDHLLKDGYTKTHNSDVYGPVSVPPLRNLNALRNTLKTKYR
jgi:predicted acylesterase/phospholipase RssA